MQAIGIIPARYQSSRYPGKPLVPILGKPLVIHVAERAAQALGRDQVYVATEDERILQVVEAHGFQGMMTATTHPTGTDRLWEVAQQVPADVYVNIQGDEPMVDPRDILRAAELKRQYPDRVINGMCPVAEGEDPANVNLPKVLFNRDRQLIYMSRLPIPGIKDPKVGKPTYWKQVCIYAFSYADLQAYGTYPGKAVYEQFEDIEITRFFDLGIGVQMMETQHASLAVDVPTDVAKVEAALSQSSI